MGNTAFVRITLLSVKTNLFPAKDWSEMNARSVLDERITDGKVIKIKKRDRDIVKSR